MVAANDPHLTNRCLQGISAFLSLVLIVASVNITQLRQCATLQLPTPINLTH